VTVSPKLSDILLQFLHHFKAHAPGVHKSRAVEFCTVAPVGNVL
jgi:hypothetical protein